MGRIGYLIQPIVAGLVVAAGCTSDGGSPRPAAASEIIAAPDRFLGETVTIEAEVSKQIDHRVWEMADGRLFAISDRGVDPAPSRGERLRIIGSVHRLERETIEKDLEINIEDRFFDDASLQDDVAIVTEDVTRLRRR
jgi:hypothetical protein